MFTITAQHILGFFLVFFSILSLLQFRKVIKQVKEIMKHKKLIKEKQASVEKMKADGEFHDWINIPTPAGEIHVCRKTGYCPKVNGFFPLEAIKQYEKQKQDEIDYKEYRDKKVEELAIEQGLTVEEMEVLVKSIFNMKKTYYIEKMEQSLKEMGEVSGKNIKIVTNMDELKEVIDELDDKDKKIH